MSNISKLFKYIFATAFLFCITNKDLTTVKKTTKQKCC